MNYCLCCPGFHPIKPPFLPPSSQLAYWIHKIVPTTKTKQPITQAQNNRITEAQQNKKQISRQNKINNFPKHSFIHHSSTHSFFPNPEISWLHTYQYISCRHFCTSVQHFICFGQKTEYTKNKQLATHPEI